MKRPDLSKDGKFDGWQVLDPTPQEMSDGKPGPVFLFSPMTSFPALNCAACPLSISALAL